MLYERVRHCRLEDRFLQYLKSCEIQEQRYAEILQTEASIARYVGEFKDLLASHKRALNATYNRPSLSGQKPPVKVPALNLSERLTPFQSNAREQPNAALV